MGCSLPGSSVHGDSPGKNTGVGCHALLQGIFPTQGSNPSLLRWRRILYHLSHQELHPRTCLFYNWNFVWVDPLHPFLSTSPCGNHQSALCLQAWFWGACFFFFSNFIYDWDHAVFVFLWLAFVILIDFVKLTPVVVVLFWTLNRNVCEILFLYLTNGYFVQLLYLI